MSLFIKSIISFLILISTTQLCDAQINTYLRKAEKAIEKNKIEDAKNYYLSAYKIDKNNFEANLGLGFVLCEFMAKYTEAIPYLETAYYKDQTDTVADLYYSLAKCYNHHGKFTKAYELYQKLAVKIANDQEQDTYTVPDIKKRAQDCLFANQYKDSLFDKNIYVGNLGPKINTDMPEYVPVIKDNNELIFTSRRKDSEKEKRSKEDDKYFENMYVSKLENGKPQPIKEYDLGGNKLQTNYSKKHVSVVSSSHDGKTMFLFIDNNIYEIKVDADQIKRSNALSKNVNIDYYQNHASISKDGRAIFFTSEDERGFGGLDIYKSSKEADGTWGIPVNLGSNINTPYDEDSPYLADDGKTLYFASKGHPGFGNYDIYQSKLINGEWSVPDNLGQPINSPDHDIFFVQSSRYANAYFSSNRKGGFGDMDIYKITYFNKFNQQCREKQNNYIPLEANLIDKNLQLVNFRANIPAHLNIISCQWKFNQTILTTDSLNFTHKVSNTEIGDSIYVKIIAGCDTCLDPVVLCNFIKYQKPKELLVSKTDESLAQKNLNISENNQKTDQIIYDADLKVSYLKKSQIDSLKLDLSPIYFTYNQSNISKESTSILNKNLKILSKHPELSILIYGFADSRGSDKHNLKLSEQRALKIKSYLLQHGLKSTQIKNVTGKGETSILNHCKEGVICNETEHAQNRRVEIVVIENK